MRAVALFLIACGFSVHAAAVAAPVDPVSEAAARALLAWMSRQGLAGVVQPRSLGRALDPLSGNFRLEARPISAEQLRRRMVVWVDISAAEGFVRSVPVALDVELSQDAVSSPDVASRGMNSERMGAGVVLDRAIDVVRGEWAALRTSAGAVFLESRVEVLQDGRAGDRIRVRQQGATGIVLARVIGRGQLELAP